MVASASLRSWRRWLRTRKRLGNAMARHTHLSPTSVGSSGWRCACFFDKGPECVDVDLGEMEIADESRTDGSRVLPCQVEPVENAMRRVMGETCYRPQTVALAQEGQGFDRHQAWATHGLEERVRIDAKGVSTSRTVVTLFNVTEDLDVASFDCATIRTGFGVTPLPREFHAVFPPSQHDDTSNGLSWLGVPSEGFTAYVYSTRR